MVRALIASLAILFTSGAAPVQIRIQPARGVISSEAHSSYDSEAERQLFALANQARTQAGLAPLQVDEGLTKAARAHAVLMAKQRQLSHQFSGEPSLPQRLSADSDLHMDRSGENVAYASNAEQAQDGLMHSPPHRENLLNPGYNAAGFGVVRSGNILYVTQDFAHQLPVFSPETAEELVTRKLNQARTNAGLPPLQRMQGSIQAGSCPAPRASLLKTSVRTARYILRYTSMEPGTLPAGTEKATADRSLQAFSVGACYARNATYPNGAYWVVVEFF